MTNNNYELYEFEVITFRVFKEHAVFMEHFLDFNEKRVLVRLDISLNTSNIFSRFIPHRFISHEYAKQMMPHSWEAAT